MIRMPLRGAALNPKDAGRLEEIARAHRLRVAERFEGGSVALLRR